MASTIGTARGNTQGSCLPLGLIVISLLFMSTVFCSFNNVAIGLKATLK
jgi:hypothetical protein